MKWEGNRQSDNVEDRRHENHAGGDGGARISGGRGIGLGSVVIALLVGWVFGINPLTILGVLSGGDVQVPQARHAPAQRSAADDHMSRFVSTVLADTEDVWTEVFAQGGAKYAQPKR